MGFLSFISCLLLKLIIIKFIFKVMVCQGKTYRENGRGPLESLGGEDLEKPERREGPKGEKFAVRAVQIGKVWV